MGVKTDKTSNTQKDKPELGTSEPWTRTPIWKRLITLTSDISGSRRLLSFNVHADLPMLCS